MQNKKWGLHYTVESHAAATLSGCNCWVAAIAPLLLLKTKTSPKFTFQTSYSATKETARIWGRNEESSPAAQMKHFHFKWITVTVVRYLSDLSHSAGIHEDPGLLLQAVTVNTLTNYFWIQSEFFPRSKHLTAYSHIVKEPKRSNLDLSRQPSVCCYGLNYLCTWRRTKHDRNGGKGSSGWVWRPSAGRCGAAAAVSWEIVSVST